ncbi:MAG: Holliday junction resolvase RuvX [Sedimentisphaerales bacterium]|nr:Holliday junction resolvase RuvX [Sedimentisphaerales bacterium]
MRFLCIDLGDKRTGLAICDSDETIASPVETIEDQKDLIGHIAAAIKQYDIEAVVLGLPLNMDGSEGDRAAVVRKFANKLTEKIGIEIFFQDERLSSFSATDKLSRTGLTHKKKKNRIDAIAAAEILKEFIAARK